jgi:hypothetical protein
MVSPPTASRLLLAIATLGAAAAVVALLSCWNVGWLSDDWVLLDGVQHGAFLEELRHVTVPRRALWWASMHGAGPWLFRLVAIGCHVAASLVVLPRLGRLFFPAWPIATGYVAGLGLLGLPVAFDAMVWPATVAYPILELELLAVAYAHLRWLRGGGRAWRVGSVLATAAALGTWELGISAPLVVAVLSVLTAARGRRAIRDVAPHALLLGPWLVLKLGLSSTARLEWLGVTRLVGHVLAAPLLALSPWPLNYRFLTSPAGAVLAVAVFVLALAAAWRVSREGTALLTLAVAVLLPVLPGPGPEARYLMLAAPWLVLLATAATRDVVVRSGPAGYVVLALAFVGFYGVAGAASWWMAARWRTAGAISRDILDGGLGTYIQGVGVAEWSVRRPRHARPAPRRAGAYSARRSRGGRLTAEYAGLDSRRSRTMAGKEPARAGLPSERQRPLRRGSVPAVSVRTPSRSTRPGMREVGHAALAYADVLHNLARYLTGKDTDAQRSG